MRGPPREQEDSQRRNYTVLPLCPMAAVAVTTATVPVLPGHLPHIFVAHVDGGGKFNLKHRAGGRGGERWRGVLPPFFLVCSAVKPAVHFFPKDFIEIR